MNNALQANALLQGGKYRIIKALGQGGFGITYLAEQTALERQVCIKEFFMKDYGSRVDDGETTILSAITSTAAEVMHKYREKFVKEARTIARMEHPGIVKIHDVFQENGTAYYVMDYIEGDNLNDLVEKEGPLPERRALKYIRQVADALEYVHGLKVMHLDVKPSNVIVRKSDDRAILIDFGAAKQYDAAGTQTSTTPIGVSAGYAPIELMKIGGLKNFSPETDVYSLGATLFYLVTGTNPPDASDVLEEGLPTLPDALSDAVRRAISASMMPRKQRLKSVDAFLGVLDQSVSTPVTESEPVPPVKQVSETETKPGRTDFSVAEPEDKSNKGLNILSFLFPVIGWVMYFIFRNKAPVMAKACSKWAWIGFGVNVVFFMLGGI